MDCTPSDILHTISEGYLIYDSIATDTETSGLFADDGARVSTASVAWQDPDGLWAGFAAEYDNVSYQVDQIAPGYEVTILSVAWPFDQGTEGKPEDTGQAKLWPEAENLSSYEWRCLLELLMGHELDMHNGKFDCEKYRVGVRRWPGVGAELIQNLVWDSQNVNDLLWRLFPTSLKPSVSRLTGKNWADEAEAVKKYLKKSKLPAGRWDLMPWEVIGQYADTDARITKILKLRQIWEIEHNEAGKWLYYEGRADYDRGVFDKIQRRLEVTKILYAMERRGVPYDEVESNEAGIECRNRAKTVATRLPFAPTLPAAKQYFFGEGTTSKGEKCLDMVPYSTTPKGEPQLTAEIAERMVNDRVPHADKWGEYQRVTNAASMWYEGYAAAMGTDGRLRTSFRQNGTRSTRFSVERVNLQAIPQDYRLSNHTALVGIPTPRRIIAKAVASLPGGWRLYELDLAQAELRIATMFAKCALMETMIRDGEDLHTFTTRSLFPHIEFLGPQWGEYRQVGKRGNFSLQFGSGGRTFKNMVSKETGIMLGDQEAERIVEDWNALYPEFRRAITRHQRVVEKRQGKHGFGWVDLVNGERRWFQAYEEAHKAFNQRVQANLGQFGIDWMRLSDPMLAGEMELQKKAARDGIGEPGLVLTIHDSQVLLLPDDEYGQSLAERCAQFGKDLWAQMFAGIPGDVDYHAWDYKEIA